MTEYFCIANHPCATTSESVCWNGGVCIVKGVDYLCKCAVGWSGRNCQTRDGKLFCNTIDESQSKMILFFSCKVISSCNPSPCGAHGSCVDAVSSSGTIAYCNCENGWTGKFCDVNMDGRY